MVRFIGGLVLALLILAAALMLYGKSQYEQYQDRDYAYLCLVDNVEGGFLNHRSNIRTTRRMMTMYRVTNGVERTFMFSSDRVQCAERDDG